MWFLAGCLAVGLGLVGIALPVIPTTGPMVLAAYCFARSSPRAEAWVLRLPGVGPMIADFRAGLGMPRRAKIIACSMICLACTISAILTGSWWARAAIGLLGAIGVGYIAWRVPTRETVLATRAAADL